MKFELSTYNLLLLKLSMEGNMKIYPPVKVEKDLYVVQYFVYPKMFTNYFKTAKQAGEYYKTFSNLEKRHIHKDLFKN